MPISHHGTAPSMPIAMIGTINETRSVIGIDQFAEFGDDVEATRPPAVDPVGGTDEPPQPRPPTHRSSCSNSTQRKSGTQGEPEQRHDVRDGDHAVLEDRRVDVRARRARRLPHSRSAAYDPGVPSIFTRIIDGEIPGRFVWKDEVCVAFLDVRPLGPRARARRSSGRGRPVDRSRRRHRRPTSCGSPHTGRPSPEGRCSPLPGSG